MNDRYVLLGLAHPRAPWFSEVARWATAGSAPIDFVKCVSAEEVHARLTAGRVVSALLADADRVANDRDLVDRASRAQCAVIVVEDGRINRDWRALGIAAVLDVSFGRDDLVAALASSATPIGRVEQRDVHTVQSIPTTWRGNLVAVTGAGGTGKSTIAMALAQRGAVHPRNAGSVLLADLALDADLAMLHDARDVVPGLQELVEACRGGMPIDDLSALVYGVTDRGYDLLLGLRRHRDWTVIKPRAFDVALDTVRRRYRLVVADVDPDVEGEDETGSLDVAERNHLARHTLRTADVVLVVGIASMKGLHSLTRVLHELRAAAIPGNKIVPVLNHAGRSPRVRAELSRALAALGALDGLAVAGPVFVPERRHLDDNLVHAAPLPASMADGVASAVQTLIDRPRPVVDMTEVAEGTPVTPGSLGAWYDEPEDAA